MNLTMDKDITKLETIIKFTSDLEINGVLPKQDARDIRACAQAAIEINDALTRADLREVGYDEDKENALSEIEGRFKQPL